MNGRANKDQNPTEPPRKSWESACPLYRTTQSGSLPERPGKSDQYRSHQIYDQSQSKPRHFLYEPGLERFFHSCSFSRLTSPLRLLSNHHFTISASPLPPLIYETQPPTILIAPNLRDLVTYFSIKRLTWADCVGLLALSRLLP